MPLENPEVCPGDALKVTCFGQYARRMGHGEVWGWGQGQYLSAIQCVCPFAPNTRFQS